MLELKEYTLTELSEILGSKGKGAVDKKLKSWGIAYTVDETRGENRIYTISHLCDLHIGHNSNNSSAKNTRYNPYFYTNE